MKQLTMLPHKVRLAQNQWIPMSDGVRLATRIWLPEDALRQPVPAILEYNPYRKRDGTATRDEMLHGYFAGHGYACIRVDIRGSGDSEGTLLDRHSAQERQDGLEILRWIAAQSWCDGQIGMIGLSWGGIAALQLAAQQPEQLKAVIVGGVSLDNYHDDGGYFIGGLPGQTLGFSALLQSYVSNPPDPQTYGVAWRRLWLERLQQMPFYLQTWLSHQRRDNYWQEATICADLDRIQCPVYVFSGWADSWANATLQLLEKLSGPRQGVIGSWGHMYPHLGLPGPGIAFPQRALRWWDHYLKGINNGITAQAMLHCYQQRHIPANAVHDMRSGKWIAIKNWPSSEVSYRRLYLAPNGLSDEPVAAGLVRIRSPLSVGQMSGEYMPVYASGEASQLASDQRLEDAKSVLFDSAPLKQPLDFLGTPWVELDISSDKPSGLVAARLCDVAPNGSSSLITLGILNLAQREGREAPLPINPGERYQIRLRLNDVGYRLLPGHRLRLALSTSCWPRAWPVPDAHNLDVRYNDSFLELPICPLPAADLTSELFSEAEVCKPYATQQLRPFSLERRVSQDLKTGLHHYDVITDEGIQHFDRSDLTCEAKHEEHYTIADDDPLSARAEYRHWQSYSRGDWLVRTENRVVVTCDADDFILQAETDAFEGDKRVFSNNWDIKIPRDGF